MRMKTMDIRCGRVYVLARLADTIRDCTTKIWWFSSVTMLNLVSLGFFCIFYGYLVCRCCVGVDFVQYLH